MRKLTWLVLVLMIVGSFAGAAMAAEPSPWTNETTTKGKMLGKLDYGVKNLFFGWTELFKHPIAGYKEDNMVGGMKGLLHGVYYGLADTIGGALHVVTFPIPIDVPLPEGGVHFGDSSVK